MGVLATGMSCSVALLQGPLASGSLCTGWRVGGMCPVIPRLAHTFLQCGQLAASLALAAGLSTIRHTNRNAHADMRYVLRKSLTYTVYPLRS